MKCFEFFIGAGFEIMRLPKQVINIAGGAVRLGGQTIWEDVNLEVQPGNSLRFWGLTARASRLW